MIWLFCAALTLLVLAVLLWPLLRRERDSETADRGAYDRTVFRDQLSELDRDVARGIIGEKDAEAARNEISRRLIAAAGGPAAATHRAPAALAVITALIVPLVAYSLYFRIGSPGLPDVPLQARIDRAVETGDFDALIAKVERHLAGAPDDVQGWRVLAPAYQRVERWGDAADAYKTIMRLTKPDAELLSSYAEMLVFANNGMVSAEAHRSVREVLALDPRNPKARFFDALALKQEGKSAEAKAAFDAFLKDTPADAPWRPMLEAEIRDLGAKPPALSQEQMDSAAGMSKDDQQAMIRSMVDGLDQRLKANGDDLDGWLRLIRARSVLNEADKAAAAYKQAKLQFKDNPEALAALDGLAQELKIQ
jgi:cytochrome c-type biogenesis protein CcmH